MAFINLEHVDTNFGKTAPIKCPVCHNDFLVGADDNQPHGWPYLIHVPRVLKETDDQFIRKDELTCPFLLKPIALSIDCPDFYRNVLGYSFREKFLPADYKDYPDDYVGFMVEPDMFLPDLIKSYSRMMKLRGTTCRYCGGTYEFSYKVDKDAGEFTFNFGCQCISSDGDPDLIQLTQDFMYNYDTKMPEHNKRADFLDSVISRMPAGAIKEN